MYSNKVVHDSHGNDKLRWLNFPGKKIAAEKKDNKMMFKSDQYILLRKLLGRYDSVMVFSA